MSIRVEAGMMVVLMVVVGAGCTQTGTGPCESTVPASPTDPVGWMDSGEVQLFWLVEQADESISCNIYRRIGSSDFTKINDEPIAGVPPGQDWMWVFRDGDIDAQSEFEYCYYATAVDSEGCESLPSPEVSLVPSEVPGTPQPVEGMNTPPGANDVPVVPVFTWSPLPEAASYWLWLARSGSDVPSWIYRDEITTFQLGATSGATYWPFAPGRLDYDTKYWWQVLGINEDNMIFAVGEATFRTVEREVPSD
jgi:hypothetical protein